MNRMIPLNATLLAMSEPGETAEFQGKSVLVTGGASGIGRATVTRFAELGAHVTIADVAVDDGHEVEELLTKDGLSVEFITTDVTNESDIARAVTVANKPGLPLYAAANCAGGDLGTRPLTDITVQELTDWDRTVSLCLSGVFLSMKHEITAMLAGGGGSIVNVTSLSGMRPGQASAAYSAAKAAVATLSGWTAVHYGARNIRINSVAPGLTMTPMVKKNMNPERFQEMLSTLMVIPRAVQPEETAAAIVWLCSSQAGMITGHELPVDGGYSAR
jgi:NAD(P)-dependent dehydrogenase (short-subunit alcohol dehydrogenase family)